MVVGTDEAWADASFAVTAYGVNRGMGYAEATDIEDVRSTYALLSEREPEELGELLAHESFGGIEATDSMEDVFRKLALEGEEHARQYADFDAKEASGMAFEIDDDGGELWDVFEAGVLTGVNYVIARLKAQGRLA